MGLAEHLIPEAFVRACLYAEPHVPPVSSQVYLPQEEGAVGFSTDSEGDEYSSQGDFDTDSTTSDNTSQTSCTAGSLPDDFSDQGRQHDGLHSHADSSLPTHAPTPDEYDLRKHPFPESKLEELKPEYPTSIDPSLGQETDFKPPPSQSTRDSSPIQPLVQPTVTANRSRRRCSDSTSQPPSLKRDTDHAELFVHQLIAFTCRLITAIWPLAAVPPMMTACFNGAGVLPLETFIYETLRRSKTSYSTLQIALYYLVMLKPRLSTLDFTKEQPSAPNSSNTREAQGCRAMQCGRRAFLSSLMLASKYIQDRNYSTRAWSKISGLRIPEINDNERQYLKLIDYDLHLKQETFENWSKLVLLLSKVSKFHPGSSGDLPNFSGWSTEPDPKISTCFETLRHGTYSEAWWKEIFKDMSAKTFKNSAATDAFIRRCVPLDGVGTTTPTPPIPFRSAQGSADLTFNDSFASGWPASNVSTPAQIYASSPAPSIDLPVQPRPRNLQTPQSTPGGPGLSSELGMSNCPPRIPRTSMSVDALRTTGEQRRGYNASLDRCPPPQPQQSMPFTGLQHITHSPFGMKGRYFRSRSNSISSNSSRSSTSTDRFVSSRSSCSPAGPLPTFSNDQSRPCLNPRTGEIPRHLRRRPGFRLAEITHYQGDNAEILGSSGAVTDEAAAFAASALVDLRVGDRQSLTPTVSISDTTISRGSTPKASLQRLRPRGHKRTISKANDDLQDNVRRELLLLRHAPDVVEDSSGASFATENDGGQVKQVQMPYRSWANPKRPVSKSNYLNKRQACSSQQQHVSATDLTSTFLQADLQRFHWGGGLSY